MDKKKRDRKETYPSKQIRDSYKEQARLQRLELRTMSPCSQRVFLLNAIANEFGCSVATVRNKVPIYDHIKYIRKYL